MCRSRLCKSVGDVVWNPFSKVGKNRDNVYDLKHREKLTALSGDDREEDLIISHREDSADQYVACGVGTIRCISREKLIEGRFHKYTMRQTTEARRYRARKEEADQKPNKSRQNEFKEY